MARRTNAQIFVDQLMQNAGGEDIWVGNSKLREQLGWPSSRYDRVKQSLVKSGNILVGPGKGGTVKLPKTESSPAKVFISYCHMDKSLKEELIKHLSPLERLGLIEIWTDLEIKPGDEWDKEISKNIESADIVLLLISIDFINSKYCYDVELEQAISRFQDEGMRIVPVILRPCMWKHTSFAKFQALPSEAKAVTTWNNQDEALSDVAQGLYNLMAKINKL